MATSRAKNAELAKMYAEKNWTCAVLEFRAALMIPRVQALLLWGRGLARPVDYMEKKDIRREYFPRVVKTAWSVLGALWMAGMDAEPFIRQCDIRGFSLRDVLIIEACNFLSMGDARGKYTLTQFLTDGMDFSLIVVPEFWEHALAWAQPHEAAAGAAARADRIATRTAELDGDIAKRLRAPAELIAQTMQVQAMWDQMLAASATKDIAALGDLARVAIDTHDDGSVSVRLPESFDEDGSAEVLRMLLDTSSRRGAAAACFLAHLVRPAPPRAAQAYIRAAIADPAAVYTDFVRRVDAAGRAWPMMPMPEYAGALEVAERAVLATPDSPGRSAALAEALSVRLRTTVEAGLGGYVAPYEHPYPRVPTLMAIYACQKHLEAECRKTPWPGMVPLYHSDRYMHYMWYCLYTQYMLVIPTAEELSLEDLVRLSAFPIAAVGVATTAIFSDGYDNGPLDFFIHDWTHARRKAMLLVGHDYGMLQSRLTEMLSRCSCPEYMTLLFELVHEDALPPLPEVLMRRMREPNGTTAPFEEMHTEETPDVDMRLTPFGNIDSGARALGDTTGRIVALRIFRFTSLSAAASVLYKIRHGFLDPVDAPSDMVWRRENRAPAAIERCILGFVRDVLQHDPAEIAEQVHESIFNTKGLRAVFTRPEIQD